ncbi:F-box/kelch-repeat protein At1g57790 [Linum grandiflorum]
MMGETLVVNCNISVSTSYNSNRKMSKCSWADLLPELLQSILSRLYGKDVPVFQAVCRQWYSIHAPVHDIAKQPLLLRYRPDNNCELYSPAYAKTYFLRELPDPLLRDTQIHSFNHGWLLLSRARKFFFLHPTTGETILLPGSNSSLPFNVMCFSAPPTSPNCVVIRVFDAKILFGIGRQETDYSRMYISFTRRGDTSWKVCWARQNTERMEFYPGRRLVANKIKTNRCKTRLTCKADFRWSSYRSAPVFHKGAFYCISQEGRLGVFNPNSRYNMWKVINVKCRSAFNNDKVAYLMESSRGELISVLVGEEFVRVFRYDHVLKLWQSVYSIGDQVAFLSPTSSMMLSSKELQVKRFRNTIQFPSFHRHYNLFYSLSTNRFHSSENGEYTSNTELPLNCTWMVPKFQRFSGQTPLWKDRGEGDLLVIDDHPSHCIRNLGISSGSRCKKSSSSEGHKMIITTEQKRPWIILSHRTGRTFVDLVNRAFHARDKMEASLMSKQVYGVSSGKVALVDVNSGEWALLDMSSMAMDALPTWKIPKDFKKSCCVIHLPAGESRFVVMVFGRIKLDEHSVYRFMTTYCRVGDEKWTLTAQVPRIYSAVAYRGKIYGCGEQHLGGPGLFGIDLQQEDSRNRGAELVKLPEYEPMGGMGCTYYLVESCSRLFLFEKFMSDKGDDFEEVIMEARAYRLDEEIMKWEALRDLGDMAFFAGIGTSGFVCSASGLGLPRNSLYFVDKFELDGILPALNRHRELEWKQKGLHQQKDGRRWAPEVHMQGQEE